MAVPAEIRTVPRPVNTIVDDSGTNSPKRYAVRQRASSKYIPGGNPQPKNGKAYSPTDWECFNAFNKLKSIIIR